MLSGARNAKPRLLLPPGTLREAGAFIVEHDRFSQSQPRREMQMAIRKISGKELPVVSAVSDRFVLVDFSATWCGPCRMLHPVLEQLSGELSGWDFYEMDIDQNQNEAASFGVRGVPTMIVFKAGKEIDRLVGFRDKPSLLSGLQAIAAGTN